MRIVIGAGETSYDGWVITQENELNLLDRESLARRFAPSSIEAMLAEHVWEHMTEAEAREAARHCFEFLQPGGYIRCAVPDANFRNDAYQQGVKIGGPGPADHPAASHKIIYDCRLLCDVFEQAGFDVTLLEWCDDHGDFHYTHWNSADGHVGRSYRYDTRNSGSTLGMVSIIIDARKPLIIPAITYSAE